MTMNRIGIRRETKNRWERRAPLNPIQVQRLINDNGLEVQVQPSDLRVFSDDAYREAGAKVSEDLKDVEIILGVKEIPNFELESGKTYLFFSHTIKGQPHNMGMLRKLMDLGCTLIDYEKVVDENDRRLIFFGWHAGIAGVVDSLWVLGRRLEWEGLRNPFSSIMKTHEYGNLHNIREHISSIGRMIVTYGIPYTLRPFVIGIAGSGNVSKGVQDILDLLPVKEVSPEELPNLKNRKDSGQNIYKVVFNEIDMVERADPSRPFDLKEYYDHPELYRSRFSQYLPYMTMLLNCIYWDARYPRLVTKERLKELYSEHRPAKLRVIGDISCDIEGAVEATIKPTTPEDPVYVYEPWEDIALPGWRGSGPVIMAVDNLPCEIPEEASEYFGDRLKGFLPHIATSDLSVEFSSLKLPKPIKNAVIVHRGQLTPGYQYLERFLDRKG